MEKLIENLLEAGVDRTRIDRARRRGIVYQCKRCLDQDGTRISNIKCRMEEHIMRVHLSRDEQPFHCKLCGFRCTKREQLHSHVNDNRHILIAARAKVVDSLPYLVENPNPHVFGPQDYVAQSQEASLLHWLRVSEDDMQVTPDGTSIAGMSSGLERKKQPRPAPTSSLLPTPLPKTAAEQSAWLTQISSALVMPHLAQQSWPSLVPQQTSPLEEQFRNATRDYFPGVFAPTQPQPDIVSQLTALVRSLIGAEQTVPHSLPTEVQTQIPESSTFPDPTEFERLLGEVYQDGQAGLEPPYPIKDVSNADQGLELEQLGSSGVEELDKEEVIERLEEEQAIGGTQAQTDGKAQVGTSESQKDGQIVEEERTQVMNSEKRNEEEEQVQKSKRQTGGVEVGACQSREDQRIVVERSNQQSKEEVQVEENERQMVRGEEHASRKEEAERPMGESSKQQTLDIVQIGKNQRQMQIAEERGTDSEASQEPEDRTASSKVSQEPDKEKAKGRAEQSSGDEAADEEVGQRSAGEPAEVEGDDLQEEPYPPYIPTPIPTVKEQSGPTTPSGDILELMDEDMSVPTPKKRMREEDQEVGIVKKGRQEEGQEEAVLRYGRVVKKGRQEIDQEAAPLKSVGEDLYDNTQELSRRTLIETVESQRKVGARNVVVQEQLMKAVIENSCLLAKLMDTVGRLERRIEEHERNEQRREERREQLERKQNEEWIEAFFRLRAEERLWAARRREMERQDWEERESRRKKEQQEREEKKVREQRKEREERKEREQRQDGEPRKEVEERKKVEERKSAEADEKKKREFGHEDKENNRRSQTTLGRTYTKNRMEDRSTRN